MTEMPKYTLVYFDLKAGAELSRLLFAQAGVEYTDKRVSDEEWLELKPKTPTGHLPYIEFDGMQIAQSMAIARYLAREFDMYGETNVEKLKIDMILDCIVDINVLAVAIHFSPDKDTKTKYQDEFAEKAPKTYKLMSHLLAENGTGFMVGEKLSVADLAVFHYLPLTALASELEEMTAQLETHVNLTELNAKISELPNIKAWLEKRPNTIL